MINQVGCIILGATPFSCRQPTRLSLVFIRRENPRRSGILLFPDRPRFCRYDRKIAGHRRNLGRVGKIETLPIVPLCPRPLIPDDRGFVFS